ncbi:MAG: CpXC domain-containing protein [Elusimicrobiota bacterium]
MSFKGRIEAACPDGCEPFDAEIWSFIRGDQSSDLRFAIIAGECNLIMCPNCGRAFFPEEPFVYMDSAWEILAFIFPEKYRSQEEHWRSKMAADFAAMKEAMGSEVFLDIEPQVFFESSELARILEDDDYLGEEQEVMAHFAKKLGLELYRASPRHAREKRIPNLIPYAPEIQGGPATVSGVLKGIEKLLAANDALISYMKFRDNLAKDPDAELPPPARER